MSYSPNYLTEIKNRLALTILTGSSCILVNFLYLDDLLYIIIKPLLVKNNDFYFIFTDVSEPFYINIKLILYTSSQIFYLVLCSQFILFLKPGLYKNEYEYIKYLSVYSCILFLIYFKISYSLLIPWSFSFFFTHNDHQKIDLFFEAKMNEYLKIVFSAYEISLICAIICTLFYAFLIKKNLRYITTYYRKYIYVSILSISSIVTPPDVVSQLILTIITVIIFEFVIYTTFIYLRLRKPIKTNKYSYSKN